ncbi:MAG: hypothetical protein RMJ67_01310 [Elusimicrobiota bacterium]|nr:hypothetical protein [Endomicrobiia bacterium]MDW8165142.1 hypothetical protein [Elusimicrobiota bacterium]
MTNNIKKIISIDAGAKGSIAVIKIPEKINQYYNDEGKFMLTKFRIKEIKFYNIAKFDIKTRINKLRDFFENETKEENLIFIENVHPNKIFGSKSSFTFGFSFARIITALEILKLSPIKVKIGWRIKLIGYLKKNYPNIYSRIKNKIGTIPHNYDERKEANTIIAKILMDYMYEEEVKYLYEYLNNHHNADALLIAISGLLFEISL